MALNAKQSKLKHRIRNWFPTFNKEDHWQWADYIEFLCLVSWDSQIAISDFVDRWQATKMGKGKLATVTLDDEDDDDEDEEDTAEVEDLVFRKTGKLDSYAAEYFEHIRYRSAEFGQVYPFVVSEQGNSITLVADLSAENRLYIFLMLCSLLGVTFDYKPELTTDFESLCFELFDKMLPLNSEKRLFAAGNTSGASISKSTLFNKLNSLSAAIREPLITRESDLSPYNKGDGGLDIYGFSSLGDNLTHFPVFFGQCACTPEWKAKQYTATFEHWRPHINLSVPVIPVIFIPYSFRSSDGGWFHRYDIKGTVLVDRKRLVYLFHDKIDTFDTVVSKNIIDEILTVKDDIV